MRYWPNFMISGLNEQLQQEFEYNHTLEERYAIEFCFKLEKKCHRNAWNVSYCFWTILHEASISF